MKRQASVFACAILLLVSAGVCADQPQPMKKPPMAGEYLSVLTTYAIHAQTLWVDAEGGGYWGDGIDSKDQNGAVRGSASTMLTYVMLAHAWDAGWLDGSAKEKLRQAELTSDNLRKKAISNLRYLLAHHKATPGAPAQQWGFSWQSSLWLGSLGPAALLLWEELTEKDKQQLAQVAGAEADRLAKQPAKSYVPGDTGAEENGWNTAAPALALAVAPGDPRADTWWETLCRYAVNTYTVPSDKQSTGTVGQHRIAEIVETATLFSDYTLDNHGFFHPDYVQVSGQHLGEAWQIIALGDRVHSSGRAEQFRPYSLFHVEDVWRNLMRKLVLPSGEFLFPAGNDWTYHCSTNQSYFAFIATALNDPDAAAAERRGILHVLNRRGVSPPGRLLGDSNLEWWWEPLVCKRGITAMLHHMLAEKPAPAPSKTALEQTSTTDYFPEAKLWMHRTPEYVVSVSWAKKAITTFMAIGEQQKEHPYTFIPLEGGFLPDTLDEFTSGTAGANATYAAWNVKGTSSTCAIVCLPETVLALSDAPFGPFGIENDSLTTPGRTVSSQTGIVHVPALQPHKEFKTGTALTVQDVGGFIADAGFRYIPAGKWNRRSVAVDQLQPETSATVCQLLPWANADQTRKAASHFQIVPTQSPTIRVHVQDAETVYSVELARSSGSPVVRVEELRAK